MNPFSDGGYIDGVAISPWAANPDLTRNEILFEQERLQLRREKLAQEIDTVDGILFGLNQLLQLERYQEPQSANAETTQPANDSPEERQHKKSEP